METPAPMTAARYAKLTGRTLDDVTQGLVRGTIPSVRGEGGSLLVATSVVQQLFAHRAREHSIVVPPEIIANTTRLPMTSEDYAVLAGSSNEAVCAALAIGSLASTTATFVDINSPTVAARSGRTPSTWANRPRRRSPTVW